MPHDDHQLLVLRLFGVQLNLKFPHLVETMQSWSMISSEDVRCTTNTHTTHYYTLISVWTAHQSALLTDWSLVTLYIYIYNCMYICIYIYLHNHIYNYICIHMSLNWAQDMTNHWRIIETHAIYKEGLTPDLLRHAFSAAVCMEEYGQLPQNNPPFRVLVTTCPNNAPGTVSQQKRSHGSLKIINPDEVGSGRICHPFFGGAKDNNNKSIPLSSWNSNSNCIAIVLSVDKYQTYCKI